jgi:hypothetical protein
MLREVTDEDYEDDAVSPSNGGHAYHASRSDSVPESGRMGSLGDERIHRYRNGGMQWRSAGQIAEERRKAFNIRGALAPTVVRPIQDVAEELRKILRDDALLDHSRIEVEMSSEECVLTGTVPDRTSRRRAELWAESVEGVASVRNELRL